jgi:hypothetical protein
MVCLSSCHTFGEAVPQGTADDTANSQAYATVRNQSLQAERAGIAMVQSAATGYLVKLFGQFSRETGETDGAI